MSESQKNDEIRKPPQIIRPSKRVEEEEPMPKPKNPPAPFTIEINSENALKAVIYSEIFGPRGGRRRRRGR